ncbi:RNA polymerase sigma factor [Marinigracilibium pacificum]|nr:sigma-70 family RNA polymerase sigma factor [Marinigracilibium pacificum]
MVDHLFRHHYGKMVAVLTKVFGLSNLETIEDAVQDTFVKASLQWRTQIPDNPEAWLTRAAKNRVIDLLRKIKAERIRTEKISIGAATVQLNDYFLDHEIEDSQLRMIFVACHPSLDYKEQIAFSLKTISGFSIKEIASALLIKEESIKKRLSRARKSIIENNVKFDFPEKNEILHRMEMVMHVIYLIFNEGFHSSENKDVVREEICNEAIRLCSLLLKKESFRSGKLYALFALMCFHTARLKSKVSAEHQINDLTQQDRAKWDHRLIIIGNNAMNKAVEYDDISKYHYHAAIVAEHLKARSFEDTNWGMIAKWYEKLLEINSDDDLVAVNLALVKGHLSQFNDAEKILNGINPEKLEQRKYLFYGSYAYINELANKQTKALEYYKHALKYVRNEAEQSYISSKIDKLNPEALK